jgi:folate-dependent phosphoribosylglycinamide formyltransferase PurN
MCLVVLAGHGDSTWIVVNALKRVMSLEAVILEDGIGQLQMAKRRAAKVGWSTVIGQVMFVGYSRILRLLSRVRLKQIIEEHSLDPTPPSDVSIVRVSSANDIGTIELLRHIRPSVVVVNGTRILSREMLSAVKTVCINMHAGITPKYRGVHGAYWALANEDPSHAGVTIHLVDAGIDTGGVLYQTSVVPTKWDNFCTYPLLQLAAGLPLLLRAVNDAMHGKLQVKQPALPSRLYYHPTLWGYWHTRLTKGVR